MGVISSPAWLREEAGKWGRKRPCCCRYRYKSAGLRSGLQDAVHRLELSVYNATLSTAQNVSAVVAGWSHEQPSMMSIDRGGLESPTSCLPIETTFVHYLRRQDIILENLYIVS
jgi:hypothetical protein